MAAEQVEAVLPEGAGVEEMVADKGYHSDEMLVGLREVGVRSHVSEPERGRRCWQDKKTGETPPQKRAAQKALYANRRRVRGRRGRRLQRRRGEVVQRTFAHMYETGGLRRVWVRGHENVRKRVLIQAAACNIGLLLRRQTGVGTPRSLQGRALSAICGLIGLWRGCWERLRRVWRLNGSCFILGRRELGKAAGRLKPHITLLDPRPLNRFQAADNFVPRAGSVGRLRPPYGEPHQDTPTASSRSTVQEAERRKHMVKIQVSVRACIVAFCMSIASFLVPVT